LRKIGRVTAQQFVLELGRAMHALGSPSYRIEDTMDACSRALDLEGSFFSTPTAIFAAVGPRGSEPRTALLRVMPGEHDLGRLAELYAVRDAVVSRRLTPTEGLARVQAVLGRPVRQRPWVDPFAHALAGAGAAVLFRGSGLEVLFAAAAGLVVGLIGLLARMRPGLVDVQAPLACALVAFLVHVGARCGLQLDPTVTTVAAIVVLLPGLSFTTALAELAMHHLSSGSARLLGTLAVLLTMVVGVGIGDRLAEIAFGRVTAVSGPELPWGFNLLALLATWVAYVILLRTSPSQRPWILLAVAIGYGGARLGGALLTPELGAFVGALSVTAAANLYARWRRQPAAVVRTPGLLLLVPGSLGFRGLTTAVAGDFTQSIPFLFHMLLVGGSIVAGMLIAGVILPPPLDVEPDSRLRPIVP
jgi:uncharacterized membrane protein YjjP (DUF1212 family)